MRRLILGVVGFAAIDVFGASIPGVFSDDSNLTAVEMEQPNAASNKAVLTFPKIDRHPAASTWKRGVLTKVTSLPRYDLKSRNPWQVDMRAADLSGLDLKGSLNDFSMPLSTPAPPGLLLNECQKSSTVHKSWRWGRIPAWESEDFMPAA